MRKSVNTGSKLIPALFTLLLLTIWELAVDYGHVQRFILPSPIDILITLWKVLPDLLQHMLVTLKEAMAGFIISIAIAVFLALLMDSIQLVRKAVYPLLVVSQTIPIISLAPLFVLWFGFGLLPKIIVVILVCFFPIVISLMEGLSSVDPDTLRLVKSMGAGKLKEFTLVKFPASMTSFFSGLRIAATYSIMGAVIGEWLGGEKGLGLYMLVAKHSYASNKVLAATLVIVILSMALFKLIALLQDILMPWHKLLKNSIGGNEND